MRRHHLAAVVALVLAGPLLTASCVQDPATPGDGASADALAVTSEDGPVGEAQDEIKIVRCPTDDPVECMILCGIAGIPCRPRIHHPYHPDRGDGDLVRCGEIGKKYCTYRFDDGEECVVVAGAAWIPCIPHL
jgi:hypothetical protein